VLADIRAFRDREGLIDPGKTAEATGTLAARLRDELVRSNTELTTLKNYMRDDAPAVKVVKARIRSLETQQRVVARDLTDPDRSRTDTLSRQLGSSSGILTRAIRYFPFAPSVVWWSVGRSRLVERRFSFPLQQTHLRPSSLLWVARSLTCS